MNSNKLQIYFFIPGLFKKLYNEDLFKFTLSKLSFVESTLSHCTECKQDESYVIGKDKVVLVSSCKFLAGDSSKMVLRFLFFDNMRLNFIVYFAATTLVLMLGPEKFIPGLKKSKEAPIIDAPCGSMIGVITHSRKGRIIDSYKG